MPKMGHPVPYAKMTDGRDFLTCAALMPLRPSGYAHLLEHMVCVLDADIVRGARTKIGVGSLGIQRHC